jgi:hypothetical protein
VLYRFIKFLVFFGILLPILNCNKIDQNEIKIAISKSEKLRRLDNLCSSIALPNDISFRFKQITSKESLATVTFFYDFGKNKNEKSVKIETQLINQGWKFDDFRYYYVKGNQYIALESGYWDSNSNYSITCGEGIS